MQRKKTNTQEIKIEYNQILKGLNETKDLSTDERVNQLVSLKSILAVEGFYIKELDKKTNPLAEKLAQKIIDNAE